MFFDLGPFRAYLNDINRALITTYELVRDEPIEIIHLLSVLEKEYLSLDSDGRKASYYKIRDSYNFNRWESEMQRAACLIFLNKTGYNGMYRENSRGEYNIPHGRYTKPRICDSEGIIAASKVLQSAELLSESFEAVTSLAQQGDFIYLDPPYWPLDESPSFTGYHEEDFHLLEQQRLRDVIDRLDRKGCLVMMSNSNTKFIRESYREARYNMIKVFANRAVNCKAEGRGKVEELVIRNFS